MSNESLNNYLFTAKYRPKKLDDIVLLDRIRNEFIGGDIKQNYIFLGPAGCGKTSLAKILANDTTYLYINVSDESSVDVIRTKISEFCLSMPIVSSSTNMKVVILDEMDGASDQFYKALRGTIEKFTENANIRFIGTCNYINKIPDPIQDRFMCINFVPATKKEEYELLNKYAHHIIKICKELNIVITKDAIIEFVKKNFPSMRSMISKLQTFYDKGIKNISIDDIKILNYSFVDVFELIFNNTNPIENYKVIVSQYADKVDDVLYSLGIDLPNYIKDNYPNMVNKIPQIIIEVANYQSQRYQVIDPIISLLACVFKIQKIINSQ